MNTDAPDDWALYRAECRVLETQTRLHRWVIENPHRRFDDLFNLVTDPARRVARRARAETPPLFEPRVVKAGVVGGHLSAGVIE